MAMAYGLIQFLMPETDAAISILACLGLEFEPLLDQYLKAHPFVSLLGFQELKPADRTCSKSGGVMKGKFNTLFWP